MKSKLYNEKFKHFNNFYNKKSERLLAFLMAMLDTIINKHDDNVNGNSVKHYSIVVMSTL